MLSYLEAILDVVNLATAGSCDVVISMTYVGADHSRYAHSILPWSHKGYPEAVEFVIFQVADALNVVDDS